MTFPTQDLEIGEIRFAALVRAGTGAPVHKNRRSHGVGLQLNGREIIRFSTGEEFVLTAGTAFYMPKGSDYVVEAAAAGDCYAINFDLADERTFSPRVWQAEDHAALQARFAAAAELRIKKTPYYEMKIKSLLYDILYQVTLLPAEGDDAAARLLAPAVAYLNDHFTDPDLRVTTLANLCDVSDTYFRKLFARRFGATPAAYLIARRIDLARDLLSSGLHRVGEVYASCGYKDACRFSREFKKRVGCTPSAYAKGR